MGGLDLGRRPGVSGQVPVDDSEQQHTPVLTVPVADQLGRRYAVRQRREHPRLLGEGPVDVGRRQAGGLDEDLAPVAQPHPAGIGAGEASGDGREGLVHRAAGEATDRLVDV
ncbi:MAG: hypothetical protein ACXVGT_14420 [Oryzihumus sp.]